jgi:hypothetical protein
MSTNSNMNAQSTIYRIYPTRRRWLTRFMAHLLTGMLLYRAFLFFLRTYQDPSFAPMLIVYVPVAVYTAAFSYALTDTCVITSSADIEYKRPEFSVFATWSQVKSLKRNVFASIFGVQYYILLDKPTLTYTKSFGYSYKFFLGTLLFADLSKMIPLGKNVWEANEELENEIRAKRPSLHQFS